MPPEATHQINARKVSKLLICTVYYTGLFKIETFIITSGNKTRYTI